MLPVPEVAVAAGGHGDPVAPVVLALAVMLAAAKLGGDLAVRSGQPAVLGELVLGVVLGNLGLAGLTWFEPLRANETIAILAQLGVLILLFEVGLEATVRDMLRVGPPSLLVAVLGVVTLRQRRDDPDVRRPARRDRGDLLGGGDHGHDHDDGDAARAQVESRARRAAADRA